MKLMKLMIMFFAISVMISCTQRYGALTVATTKNISINMAEFEKVADGVTGKNTKPIYIIIPTGTPSIEDAIDAALTEYGGDLMQNVVIYYKWFYIPYVYGEYTFEVKGDVWKLKNQDRGSIDLNTLKQAPTVLEVLEDGRILDISQTTTIEKAIASINN